MQRGIGQEEPNHRQTWSNRRGQGARGQQAGQHDRPLDAAQQLFLFEAQKGDRAGRINIPHHHRKRFVGPVFPLPQELDRHLRGGVASEVETAEPFDGEDRALFERLNRGLERRFGTAPVGQLVPGRIHQEKLRATMGAGGGLCVEAAIRRIAVFGTTSRAKLETLHGGRAPVVRHVERDRVPRTTVGAVEEGIMPAAIGRVEKLPLTIRADPEVGRDRKQPFFGRRARLDGKIRRSRVVLGLRGPIERLPEQLAHPRRRRCFTPQVIAEGFERFGLAKSVDGHPGGAVAHPPTNAVAVG